MGCDIHPHVEVRINGTWHHWSAPRIERDYSLFARMADVRNGEPGNPNHVVPIASPRGLPPDGVSIPTEIAWHEDDGDGHSHSWLSGDEVEDLIAWHYEYLTKKLLVTPPRAATLRDAFGYGLGGDGLGEKAMKYWPVGVEAFRLVFWFGN